VLGRLATPLTIAAGAYDGYSGYQAAESARQRGEITDEEATVEKSEAVGGAAVGTGGALLGATKGAALGMAAGPIGAAIGGIAGGLIGWYAGKAVGRVGGGAVGNVMASTSSPGTEPTPNTIARTARTEMAPALMNAAPSQTSGPVIVDNSTKINAPQVASPPPPSGASTVITVRDTHGSHMRFQDRRAARVM
jgi:phage tail tape-measure protein